MMLKTILSSLRLTVRTFTDVVYYDYYARKWLTLGIKLTQSVSELVGLKSGRQWGFCCVNRLPVLWHLATVGRVEVVHFVQLISTSLQTGLHFTAAIQFTPCLYTPQHQQQQQGYQSNFGGGAQELSVVSPPPLVTHLGLIVPCTG